MIPVIPKNNFDTPNTKLINFAALCAWLVSSFLMAISSLIWFGQDFRGYYAAARVLLIGGNPYDYEQLVPILLNVTGRIGNNPYYYPPWFAWFITPLAWLPFEIARVIWMLFNLSIWIVGLWQLSRLLDWPSKGWRRWLVFLFATYLFAWVTWRYEQTGILLFTLLIATLLAIRKGQWAWAGVWLALLLIKPNITLILVVTIVIWLVRRGRWQPFITMCLVLAGLFLASTVATPDWYRPLLQQGFGNGLVNVLDGPGRVVAVRVNTTLFDWLTMFGLTSNWRTVIYIIAAIIGGVAIIFIVLRSNSLIQVVIVSLLVSFAVTPYALQYDFPLLTLPLFWATALFTRSRQAFWGGAILCVFIASILIWERPISDGYWIVIGLVVLTIWSWIHTTSQSIPENLLLAKLSDS
jgi:hypothetical protein